MTRLVLGLLIALVISLGFNVFLGWQWAESGGECKATVATAAGNGVAHEADRAARADEQAVGIQTIEAAKTTAATRKAQGATHDRDRAIRAVPAAGECRMPAAGVRLQSAVDEANAAAGF